MPQGVPVRRLLLAASLSVAVVGASRPATAAAGPDVRVRLLAPARIGAGKPATLVVEMVLGRGWHVNSHTPSHAYLVPTTATLSTSAGALSELRYPRHVERRFEFSEEPLAVYEGTVRFETELTVPAGVTDNVELAAVVSYQPCNEHQCFPPATAKVKTTLAIAR
jgi:hypothetical protein